MSYSIYWIIVGSESDFTPSPDFSSRPDVRTLDEVGLYDFYRQQLLPIENGLFAAGNTAEHKLIFLIGTSENNVAKARLADGRPVYTKIPPYVKHPEISEANDVIAPYLELAFNPPPESADEKKQEFYREELRSFYRHTISEIADVFYNLALLVYLDDPRFEEMYKGCIGDIANSLGLTAREGLLLGALKHEHRLVTNRGKKNIEEENAILERALFAEGIIPAPTAEHFNLAHDEMNAAKDFELRYRLSRIQYDFKRKQDL